MGLASTTSLTDGISMVDGEVISGKISGPTLMPYFSADIDATAH